MTKGLKLASWVTGDYLEWANSYLENKNHFINIIGPYKGRFLHSGEIGLLIHPDGNFIERFLCLEESNARVKTLSKLIELTSNNLSPPLNALNLLWELRYCFDNSGPEIPASNTPKINKAVDNFKRATLNLFNALGDMPCDSMDMIDGLSDIYMELPTWQSDLDFQEQIESIASKAESFDNALTQSIDMALDLNNNNPLHKAPDNQYQELINIIDNFVEKDPKQVLFDFADTLKMERFSQFNPMYQSKGGVPSADLLSIRKIIFYLADNVGITAVKNTKGILSLVAYLMKLNDPNSSKSSAENVSSQVKSAIAIYEKQHQLLAIEL